ncbi:MAG: Hpt domain-containing protein [Eubacterium sp.]|nr:Hpt domain-containing protein [Eubacterium sp.]
MNEYLRKIGLIEGVDTREGMDNTAQDIEFYLEIVRDYIEEVPVSELKSTYDARDWKGYQLNAHKIKSSSYTIGAKLIGDEAKEIESSVKDNDLEFIESHHQKFLDDVENLLERLKEAVA